MDKTKYELKGEVETANVMPKTLQVQPEKMPVLGTTVNMCAVYGRTDDDRRVWLCTFLDFDEAQAWVQASRVFGRAVRGAVIAQQETENAVEENSQGDLFGGDPTEVSN